MASSKALRISELTVLVCLKALLTTSIGVPLSLAVWANVGLKSFHLNLTPDACSTYDFI